MQTIVIIGAGLRGTLCFINLVQNRSEALRVFLVDKKEKSGPVSASEQLYIQQNLPINCLSAFTKEANHFYNWLIAKGYLFTPREVAPYAIYSAYVEELYQAALAQQSKELDIHVLDDEATDIVILQRKAFTQLRSGITLMSDKVILATADITPALLQDKKTPLAKNLYTNGFISLDTEQALRVAPNGALLDAKGNTSSILYTLSGVQGKMVQKSKKVKTAPSIALLAGFNLNNALNAQTRAGL